jgi:hypothetical protein
MLSKDVIPIPTDSDILFEIDLLADMFLIMLPERLIKQNCK